MKDEQLELQIKRLGNAFTLAMSNAIKDAGSQKKLSEQTGIHQSRISDYVNGNYDFSNLTQGTLIRIFPELEIIYSSQDDIAKCDDAISAIENRMLILFRRLSLGDKILCYENMARTYGDDFEKTRKDKEIAE